MSAAAAEPIRTPDGLNLPTGLRDLARDLPEATQAQLAGELLEALETSRSTGDLAAVQTTIRRWQLIHMMVTDPDWNARIAQQREIDAWIAAGMPERAKPMGVTGPFTAEEFVDRFPPHLPKA